jgi:hypothetical protein
VQPAELESAFVKADNAGKLNMSGTSTAVHRVNPLPLHDGTQRDFAQQPNFDGVLEPLVGHGGDFTILRMLGYALVTL